MSVMTGATIETLLPDGQQGYVHSVDTGGTVDGPGIRYVVFTAGCPLRCQYCHNPDCMKQKNGTLTATRSLVDDIASVAPMLRRGGGVTVSGGEPMVQPAFVAALLAGCKGLGLHTALDTSGFLGAKASDALLSLVDLVLLDIKSFRPDTYRNVTGVDVAPTLAFAERLAAMGKPTWVRYVLVPGLTDNLEEIGELADFVAGLGNVERIELLPFHKMGEYKWEALGMPYRLKDTDPPTPELEAAVRGVFEGRGLLVV